ncbi:14076_t:CDS:2, partial [Racocetra persica]
LTGHLMIPARWCCRPENCDLPHFRFEERSALLTGRFVCVSNRSGFLYNEILRLRGHTVLSLLSQLFSVANNSYLLITDSYDFLIGVETLSIEAASLSNSYSSELNER